MKIEDFVKGKRPECPIPPHYKHTRVQGMHIKHPFCLWCKKKLDS